MRSKTRRSRTGAALVALTGLLGSLATVGGTAPAHAAAQVDRLAGQSRYQTAVQISRHGFPSAADVVYLARGDGFADALAAGALEGGPVLLVPSDGTVPAEVGAEVQRLDPSRVVALGGEAAVPQRTLDAVAAGRPGERLAGSSRYQTAVAISRRGFPAGAGTVYLARGDGFADALAAGALSGGPILLVPVDGTVPAEVAAEVQRLNPGTVVALGGPAAVPDSTLATLAAGRTPRRLAGPSRYQTATAITQHGFPAGASTVYLARGDGFADALAAGSLDAPVLLVPPAGPAPAEVAAEVRRLAPMTVIALGGEAAVPQSTLVALAEEGGVPGSAPRPPDPIADPGNPAPPPPGDSGGVDDSGGPIGQPEGPPPPPPSVDLPEDPVPWASVGERYGLRVPELPAGAPTRGLPKGGAGGDVVRDAMPPAPGPLPQDGGVQPKVSHQQPNFTVTEWGPLRYDSLPTQVGRLYASYNGTDWFGQCTGTVIGADQVLTAAHCFFDTQQRPISYFRFYPDLHGSQARYGYWEGSTYTAFVDAHYFANREAFWADYGILKVRPNAAGQRIGTTLGMFPVQMDGDRFTANRYTIGYPSEGMYNPANAALSQHAQCSVEFCRPYYCWSPVGGSYSWDRAGYYRSVGFGCYGGGGWSGGPIFQYSGGRLHLVSVVSTGANNVPYPCSLSRCFWHGRNSWGPTFRYANFLAVWNAAR